LAEERGFKGEKRGMKGCKKQKSKIIGSTRKTEVALR